MQYEFKAQFFKALAHPRRIQIIDALRRGPISVGELREKLQFEQSTLSQQLAFLRVRGFVRTERRGTTVLYTVSDPQIWKLLDAALEVFDNHLVSIKNLLEDAGREA